MCGGASSNLSFIYQKTPPPSSQPVNNFLPLSTLPRVYILFWDLSLSAGCRACSLQAPLACWACQGIGTELWSGSIHPTNGKAAMRKRAAPSTPSRSCHFSLLEEKTIVASLYTGSQNSHSCPAQNFVNLLGAPELSQHREYRFGFNFTFHGSGWPHYS